jgi:hypothetical protein
VFIPPSVPPALPVPQPQPSAPVEPPDSQYDLKLIVIVIFGDFTIIGSSFAYAYLAAGSHVLRAMLGAALLAILESMRIPVALKLGAGKIASKARVGLAVLILAGGMLATTINAVPIINGLWSGRVEAVRKDEAALAKAQSAKDSADAKKLAAGDAADRAGKALKIIKGHTKAIRGNFIAANNASYANTQQADRTVADAEAQLSADRQDSNLHLFYAAMTGEEVSSITDKQLAPVMRVAVFVPALLLGILTTAVSLLAVSPAKRSAETLPRRIVAREEPEAPEGQTAQAPVPVSYVVELPDEAVAPFLAAAPAPAAKTAPKAASAKAQEPAAAKPAPKPEAKPARPRGRPRTNPRPNGKGENHAY